MTVPLTSLARPRDLWAQNEYVACVNMGVGFSAQGDWWHYKFADHCESLYINPWFATDRKHVVHTWAPGLDWIGRCAMETRGR